MAKGYWLVHIDVNDLDNYPKYKTVASAAIANFGGRYLVRGGACEVTEGTARSRHVVIEFESYAQALACYHSPEYQEAAALRKAYADGEFLVLEGN